MPPYLFLPTQEPDYSSPVLLLYKTHIGLDKVADVEAERLWVLYGLTEGELQSNEHFRKTVITPGYDGLYDRATACTYLVICGRIAYGFAERIINSSLPAISNLRELFLTVGRLASLPDTNGTIPDHVLRELASSFNNVRHRILHMGQAGCFNSASLPRLVAMPEHALGNLALGTESPAFSEARAISTASRNTSDMFFQGLPPSRTNSRASGHAASAIDKAGKEAPHAALASTPLATAGIARASVAARSRTTASGSGLFTSGGTKRTDTASALKRDANKAYYYDTSDDDEIINDILDSDNDAAPRAKPKRAKKVDRNVAIAAKKSLLPLAEEHPASVWAT